MDTFQPVSPGQPIEIPAATWNKLQEAAKVYQRTKVGGQQNATGGPLNFGIDPANLCLIQNPNGSGGAILPEWSVQGFASAVVDPVTLPFEAQRRPAFVGQAPQSATDPFCITIEPAPGKGVARAVTSGLAVVQVNFSDASHTRAVPVVGQTGYLASTAQGGVPIVARAATGTGMVWAIVLVGDPGTMPPSTAPSCGYADGWAAFLLATDCLTLTVESAFGRCSPFPAITSPGYLVLQYDLASDSWLSTTSFTLPSGATAKAKFTTGDGDGPHLDLIVTGGSGSGSGSGSGGTFRMTRTCSGGGQAVFAGPTLDSGNAICAGTPVGGCGANGFYLRVKCAAVCTIPAPCCPTPAGQSPPQLPTRICVTFGTWDGGSGGASWYPALISGKTYVLTWNGGSWRYFDQIDDGASFELTFGCQATNTEYPDWALVAHFHGTSEGCGWDDYLYWRDSRNPQSPSVVASISTDIGFGDSGTNKSLTAANACSPAVAVSGSVYGEWGASGCGAGGGQTWPSGTFVTFTVAGLDPITGTCTGGGGGGGGGGGPGTNCGFGFNSPSTMTLTVTGGPYAGSWTGDSFAGPPAYWDFNMTGGTSPKEAVLEFFGGAWHLVGTVGEDEVATGGQCSPSFGLTFAGSFIPGATAVSVSIP